MLPVHLIEHQLYVFPLADFVETVLWVWVDTARCALVREEGKERLEEAFANLAGC